MAKTRATAKTSKSSSQMAVVKHVCDQATKWRPKARPADCIPSVSVPKSDGFIVLVLRATRNKRAASFAHVYTSHDSADDVADRLDAMWEQALDALGVG